MSSERKRKWDQAGEADSDQGPATKHASGGDAAEQAAAVAAQLNAKYTAPTTPAAPAKQEERKSSEDIEAKFVKDIEINDIRNRYLLTKGVTQTQISQETGASVTTKGQWYPDKSRGIGKEPPLYIHITAPTQAAVDAAVGKVNELIESDLGPLTERQSGGQYQHQQQQQQQRERPERQKTFRRWPDAKIYVGLESLRNFNLRARVVGPQGMFVKYIQAETGCKCQIKGQGSGFIENDTGQESDEALHINLAAPEVQQVERGKELAEDLLEVVREKWQEAKKVMDEYNASLSQPQMTPEQQAYYAQYYAAYAQQQQQQQQQQQPGAEQQYPESTAADQYSAQDQQASTTSTTAATTTTTSTATGTEPPPTGTSEYEQWWQQIAQLAQTDPSYQAYMYQYYQQYYGQQQATTADNTNTTTTQTPAPSAPAPPPDSAPPPPPPPPQNDDETTSPDKKAYNAVPPPPGL